MHVKIFYGSYGTCLTWPTSGQGLPLSYCLLSRNGVKYLKSESVIFPTAVNGKYSNAFRGCNCKNFPTLVSRFNEPLTANTGICAFQTLAPINLLFPALPRSSQPLSRHFKTHIPNPAALRLKNFPGTLCTLILRNTLTDPAHYNHTIPSTRS